MDHVDSAPSLDPGGAGGAAADRDEVEVYGEVFAGALRGFGARLGLGSALPPQDVGPGRIANLARGRRAISRRA